MGVIDFDKHFSYWSRSDEALIGYEEEVDTLLKKFIDMGMQDDFSEMRSLLASFSPIIQNGQIMR